jgi:hypothetical protein
MQYFTKILVSAFRNSKLGLSLLVGCSMLAAPAALAIKYKKPPQPTAPRYTTGGGVRGGCDGNAPVGLTALAPISGHVGQTSSTRPTIAWYSPNPELPMKLMWYRQGDLKETSISTQDVIVDKRHPGMMQLKFPQELAVNQVYAWRVVVDCPSKDLAYSASQIVAIAEIKVVKPSSDVQIKLDRAQGLEKAELYAEEGFWYDAWAQALSLPPNSPSQETQRALLSTLLEMENATLQDLTQQPVNCVENSLEEICQQQADLRQQIISLNAMIKPADK